MGKWVDDDDDDDGGEWVSDDARVWMGRIDDELT